jgi:hypothetical protein
VPSKGHHAVDGVVRGTVAWLIGWCMPVRMVRRLMPEVPGWSDGGKVWGGGKAGRARRPDGWECLGAAEMVDRYAGIVVGTAGLAWMAGWLALLQGGPWISRSISGLSGMPDGRRPAWWGALWKVGRRGGRLLAGAACAGHLVVHYPAPRSPKIVVKARRVCRGTTARHAMGSTVWLQAVGRLG